jgi:hypothetical protein
MDTRIGLSLLLEDDLGEKLLVVSILTLVWLALIEWFSRWYALFLRPRVNTIVRSTLMKIFWALLTIIFWVTLIRRGLPSEFDITHFSFALFVYSLYRLIRSLVTKKSD